MSKTIANICFIIAAIFACYTINMATAFADESTESENINTTIQPPPVPERSVLPVLPPEEILPPKGTGVAKPPLAWRAGIIRKSKVASGGFFVPPLAPPIQQKYFSGPKTDAKRVYLNSKDDTFFALLSTCPKKGFVVLFIDSLAGRLVTEMNSSTISFIVRSIAGNRSSVEASIERGDAQALSGPLDDLLLSTGSALASGGVF